MRNKAEIKTEYDRWLREAASEKDLIAELSDMDDAAIEDAFYRDLAFGTGGLRGVIGAGTNRMNVFTVAKASQGLADYVNAHFPDDPSIAIAFDSRIKSGTFARTAACVFAANGIKAYLYPEIMPTPCLSFAVRELGCSAGIVITASHNPSKYNGYKVYGSDGCQITTEAAADILAEIEKADIFEDVKSVLFIEGLASGLITNIGDDVYTAFTEAVRAQSVLYGDDIDRDVAIVYTPLNGTGLGPVTRALTESGFSNITVVEEQRWPDGNFPTCPYPNPEIREAMELGLQYCENTGADLLLATDPDADRCGIAVRDGGGYRLLTGNEVGLLLLDYICSQRQKHGKMPAHPVFVKTIVTMDLAEKIASHYGVETINVLTGFKFIGDKIRELEGKEVFIGGGEESYGYMIGDFVRDKDAVAACSMIAEIAAWAAEQGKTFFDVLVDLYTEYGFYKEGLLSVVRKGKSGAEEIQQMMKDYRENPPKEIDGEKVVCIKDYKLHESTDTVTGKKETINLPASNVLQYFTEKGNKVTVRPSGTEPKIKFYFGVKGELPNKEGFDKTNAALDAKIEEIKKSMNLG